MRCVNDLALAVQHTGVTFFCGPVFDNQMDIKHVSLLVMLWHPFAILSVLQVFHAHCKTTHCNATIKQRDSNSEVVICIDTKFRLIYQ